MWSATQIPHVLRVMLALVTGIPEHKLRVIAPDVGGGFGSKLQVTAEEVLALLLARKLRPPGEVDRDAGPRATWPCTTAATSCRSCGSPPTPTAASAPSTCDLLADMGAYLMLVTPGVPLLGAFMFNAIYKMDAYRFNCTGVFTTKTPTDAYRGAGRPEATYAIEHLMDDLAAELGIDPLELRERNWIKHEEFPYTTISGLTYDIGQLRGGHRAPPRSCSSTTSCARSRRNGTSAGSPVRLGIGISTFTEMCGLAPSRVLGSLAYAAGGWEHAVDPDAAHRQGGGRHRVERARPGARDRLVADRRRPARRAVRGRAGAARGHRDRAQGHGHLRVAVARRRRHRARQRLRQGKGQGPRHRGGHARGVARRPGVGRRPLGGPRRPRPGQVDRRDRVRRVRRAQPARRGRAVTRLRRDLRPGQLLLPARHAPVRGRGGHRDGPGPHPLLRRGGRRRRTW